MYYKSLLLKCDFTYTSGDFKKKYDTLSNYNRNYLLIKAVTDGDLELAKYAVQKQHADIHIDGEYPLGIAAQRGYVCIAKWLIEQGADIHAEHEAALNDACQSSQLEIVKLLVESGSDIHIGGDFPLRSAVDTGHLEIVRYLVESGANVNAYNDMALNMACQNNHLTIVKYLVEKGSNISERALAYAFSLENSEIYDYLMKK